MKIYSGSEVDVAVATYSANPKIGLSFDLILKKIKWGLAMKIKFSFFAQN